MFSRERSHIYSHLRDIFIHIQRVIFVHIDDRNMHSAFSAHALCASLGPSSRSIISERTCQMKGTPKANNPKHKSHMGYRPLDNFAREQLDNLVESFMSDHGTLVGYPLVSDTFDY